jgi:hypothetical protein
MGCSFLKAVVVFRLVLAENERRALLRVADQLSIELGYSEGEEILGAHSPLGGEDGVVVGALDSEDEALVARLRRALAKIAAAIDAGADREANVRAIGAALDGAEMVMRGELVKGNAAQLPVLMPGFVFVVALAVADQDRALELSQRTSALIEGTMG